MATRTGRGVTLLLCDGSSPPDHLVTKPLTLRRSGPTMADYLWHRPMLYTAALLVKSQMLERLGTLGAENNKNH